MSSDEVLVGCESDRRARELTLLNRQQAIEQQMQSLSAEMRANRRELADIRTERARSML